MAAEIRSKYPEAKIELLEGSGGVFEVNLDGKPIFSKRSLKRHAQPGEILGLISAQRA